MKKWDELEDYSGAELWWSEETRTPEQIRKEIIDHLRGEGCSEDEIKRHLEHQEVLVKQDKEANERREKLRARGLLPTVPDRIYSKDPFEGQPEKQKARDEYYRKWLEAFNKGDLE
jgi:hypothetical protein